MTLSKIVVSGTVTNTPEKRFTQTNLPIVSFAMDIYPQDSTVLRVIKFGASAEQLADNIKEGDNVIVEGRPQIASYTDENGKEKRTVEINAGTVEVIGATNSFNTGYAANTSAKPQTNNEEIVQFANSENVENLIDEEEIPF